MSVGNSEIESPDEQIPVHQDVIPIPLLITLLGFIWILVLFFLLPGWGEKMTAFLARRAARDGDWATSLAQYEKLVAKSEPNATYLGELGFAQLNMKQYDKAIETLNKATDVLLATPRKDNGQDDTQAPPPSPNHFAQFLGRAYYGKGDMENAEKYFKNELQDNKLSVTGNLLLGEIYVQKKEYRRAIDYLKVVLQQSNDEKVKSRVIDIYRDLENKLFSAAETSGTVSGNAGTPPNK